MNVILEKRNELTTLITEINNKIDPLKEVDELEIKYKNTTSKIQRILEQKMEETEKYNKREYIIISGVPFKEKRKHT